MRHGDMSASGEELAVVFSQHLADHAARLDHKLQLLHTLKQGTELLLLVSSYLFFYLIDCVSQVLSLPTIR